MHMFFSLDDLSDIICSALSNYLIQKYCFDRIVDQYIEIHSPIPHLSTIIRSKEKICPRNSIFSRYTFKIKYVILQPYLIFAFFAL